MTWDVGAGSSAPSTRIPGGPRRRNGLARPPRGGDLLDVCRGQNIWQEAVVRDVSEENPWQCVVHFLFDEAHREECVDASDPTHVQPYGAFCLTHLSQPDAPVRPGSIVDVVALRAGVGRVTVGQVLSHHQQNEYLIQLRHSNSGPTVVMREQLRPFGEQSQAGVHPDNLAREDYVEQLEMEFDHGASAIQYGGPATSRAHREPMDVTRRRPRPRPAAGDRDMLRTYDLSDGAGISESRIEDASWAANSPSGPWRDLSHEIEVKLADSYRRPRKRRQRGVAADGPRYTRYVQALLAQGMQIERMEGDGNCMFRAVSHQVYGSPEHHRIVREACMAYMESERAYFEPFVVGGGRAFGAYVEHKRQDGVWGDDLELQAMCEIYDRPALVFAFDGVHGMQQLRTFHEDRRRGRPPMRLSFYGGGHYDSIVGRDFITADRRPGLIEEQRLAQTAARRRSGRSDGASAASSSAEVMGGEDEVIRASRSQFFAQADQDLDATLAESLRDFDRTEQDQIDGALAASLESASAAALTDSDLAATEEAALKAVLEASRAEATSGVLAAADPELEEALRLSRAAASGHRSGVGASASGGPSSTSAGDEEDEERLLQLAIEASLRGG